MYQTADTAEVGLYCPILYHVTLTNILVQNRIQMSLAPPPPPAPHPVRYAM